MAEPSTAADTAQGLFETLLVVDSRPVELEAHLRRLAASCRQQLGLPLPAETEALALSSAVPLELGRLRLTVTAGGGDVGAARAEAVAARVDPELVFPDPVSGAARLLSRRLAGGLGAHKWVDRTALGEVKEPDVALLVDADGSVLEASRANVFAVFGGVAATPPTDGRILPGIARQGVIEVAGEAGVEIAERALTLTDLQNADEVFLTGSVRGIQRAEQLDGAPLPPATQVSRRLAAALRRRWGLPGAAAGAPEHATAPPPGRLAR